MHPNGEAEKIKKQVAQAERAAERAEAAYQRIANLVDHPGSETDGSVPAEPVAEGCRPIYTGPRPGERHGRVPGAV